jgi:hypothetical protein
VRASKRPSSRVANTPKDRTKLGSPQIHFRGGFRVLITGAHGFERTVMFALDDDPVVIAERVRETLDE